VGRRDQPAAHARRQAEPVQVSVWSRRPLAGARAAQPPLHTHHCVLACIRTPAFSSRARKHTHTPTHPHNTHTRTHTHTRAQHTHTHSQLDTRTHTHTHLDTPQVLPQGQPGVRGRRPGGHGHPARGAHLWARGGARLEGLRDVCAVQRAQQAARRQRLVRCLLARALQAGRAVGWRCGMPLGVPAVLGAREGRPS
jgi:hypothetical protein